MKYWENEIQSHQEEAQAVQNNDSIYNRESDKFYNSLSAINLSYPIVNMKQLIDESRSTNSELTHVDDKGHASMVDISPKKSSIRTASAIAEVWIGLAAFQLVRENGIQKGDVLRIAEIAGVMGSKETSRLIPLCHPLALSQVKIVAALDENNYSVVIKSHVKTCGQTGVEMEALTAVATAALTVYDMIKAVTREAEIRNIRLTSKTGGTRGDYHAENQSS